MGLSGTGKTSNTNTTSSTGVLSSLAIIKTPTTTAEVLFGGRLSRKQKCVDLSNRPYR
jgi:hypothetical protein